LAAVTGARTRSRTTRRAIATVGSLCATALAAPGVTAAAPSADAAAQPRAGVVMEIVREARRELGLKAVIVSVRTGRREVVTRALGRSAVGMAATRRMHFRNGNVAIAYLTTIMLQLRDEGRLDIDAPIARWLPDLPNAGQVTPRMLASSTSGYSDYVRRDEFGARFDANPFRRWNGDWLIRLGSSRIEFPPGTDFDYSHTGFAILGRVLARASGRPVRRLIRERILRPLRLRQTRSSELPAIPRPVLHAYTSERGVYEESTYWSGNWGTARGANMTSDIRDVATSAAAIGSGRLLSRRSHRAQLAPATAGLGPLNRRVYYGMGMPIMGGWIVLNPSLAGFQVMAVNLPSRRLTIAAVSTKTPRAGEGNPSEELVRRIARRLAPDRPIPTRP